MPLSLSPVLFSPSYNCERRIIMQVHWFALMHNVQVGSIMVLKMTHLGAL